jgi:hypothetical protein
MKLSRIAQLGLSVIHEISLEKSYGLVGQDHITFAIQHWTLLGIVRHVMV